MIVIRAFIWLLLAIVGVHMVLGIIALLAIGAIWLGLVSLLELVIEYILTLGEMQ